MIISQSSKAGLLVVDVLIEADVSNVDSRVACLLSIFDLVLFGCFVALFCFVVVMVVCSCETADVYFYYFYCSTHFASIISYLLVVSRYLCMMVMMKMTMMIMMMTVMTKYVFVSSIVTVGGVF